MKKTKIAISILVTVLIMLLLAITTYVLIDTESEIPEEIKKQCSIIQEEYMKRKIFIISPNNGKKTNTHILYFHGGSYMAEASYNHWEFLKNLTNDTGATIIMPDYPLAPKYNYKDVYKMVDPLYKKIIESINTDNLIIMGDSAGGGLGLALEEELSKQNIPMPSKTILISPWLDVKLENPEIEKFEEKDKQLNKEVLKLAGVAYAGEETDNYLVSPINGNLSNLKNITILIGTNDILNPDVKLLQQKAEEQNIQIEVKEYENAGHIWIIDNNSTKELQEQAYQEIKNQILKE